MVLRKHLKHAVLSRSSAFFFGVTLPGRALKLIFSRPKLLVWSILPTLVTLGLYSLLIVRLLDFLQDFVRNALLSYGIQSDGWIMFLLEGTIKIILLLVGAVSFSLSATVVASPFNDFLAEATEPYAEPPLPSVGKSSYSYRARLILIDVAKALAATMVSLLALCFSWVPLLNIAALLLTFLLVCFQFTSYPQTRRGKGLKEGIQFLFKYFFACLGFGAVLTFLFSIPLVSCLVLPLGVVGGTLLVARVEE